MTWTALKGGKVYKILSNEIEYIGYFYGTNGKEDIVSAYSRLSSLRGRAPDFLINCELFNFNTRKAGSDVVDNGVVHRLTQSFGLSFKDNKKAVFSYMNSAKADDYVGFYPTLIRNGSVSFATPSGLSGRRGRTAMGVDNSGNVYVALVSDSIGATLNEVAEGMKKAGVLNGGNFDGGGSSQWYSPGGRNYTGRPLRGFVAIWLQTNERKPVTPLSKKTVKVKTRLNIRSGAPNKLGVNTSKVVGTYSNGQVVNIYETRSGWCRTDKGWCHGAYLK